MKKCKECGKIKSDAQFHRHKKSKDGLGSYCKKCSSLKYKKWCKENKDHRSKYLKKWNDNNKVLKSQLYKRWYESHREEKRAYDRKYRKQRKKDDPVFALHLRMGSLVLQHLKGKGLEKGGVHWEKLLKYSVKQLIDYLGPIPTGHQIDHIYPKRFFNIKEAGDLEFRQYWHWMNLQYLSAKENAIKGDSDPKRLNVWNYLQTQVK